MSPLGGNRVFICGRLFAEGQGGGLELALVDLARALEHSGWDVDLAITPEAFALGTSAERERQIQGLGSTRWSALPRLRFLPEDVRAILQHTLLDGGLGRLQSELIRAIQQRLAEQRYDAVIACVPREAPGIARFLTEAHPQTLLLSLDGLAGEIRRARSLAWPRLAARICRRNLHPSMYRAVDPRRVRLAVFASQAWEQEAIQAGLPAAVCRTIHFGLHDVPPLPPMSPSRDRLLWVGRLSREKGLHHFIDAVAELRRRRPVVLDAICGPGPDDYRASIERQIARHDLRDIVRLLPAVTREALATAYRDHDALLFHSVFAEPVALVSAEAFAAGLAVIAPTPRAASALIKPGITSHAFASYAPADIARAIETLLDDAELRSRLRRNAHALVRDQFSLSAMGAAYDAALRDLLAVGATGAELAGWERVHAAPASR